MNIVKRCFGLLLAIAASATFAAPNAQAEAILSLTHGKSHAMVVELRAALSDVQACLGANAENT